jgi:hypothetical protein
MDISDGILWETKGENEDKGMIDMILFDTMIG